MGSINYMTSNTDDQMATGGNVKNSNVLQCLNAMTTMHIRVTLHQLGLHSQWLCRAE